FIVLYYHYFKLIQFACHNFAQKMASIGNIPNYCGKVLQKRDIYRGISRDKKMHLVCYCSKYLFKTKIVSVLYWTLNK
ncbi:MAG: hypothetical protein K8I03_13475, partial [Ignavibacteria bacterium]|nr:hypothetical protein [Ignavibacteria bacterium]